MHAENVERRRFCIVVNPVTSLVQMRLIDSWIQWAIYLTVVLQHCVDDVTRNRREFVDDGWKLIWRHLFVNIR